MNVSLVINPVAGNRAFRYITRIETRLKGRVSLSTFVTARKGGAFAYARDIRTADLIIVASGDGTINEVVNGLLSARGPQKAGIPVALIPLGITNVLAKDRGIPHNIEQAIERALTGTAKKISLGRINGTYFTLMAGVGFDGSTVMDVSAGRMKKISGKLAHVISGLRMFAAYHPPLVTIRLNEQELSGHTAVFSNARCYGGHFAVTPQADITEPALDVCIVKSSTRMAILRLVRDVILKRMPSAEDVMYLKIQRASVTSENRVHVQIDGDYFGTLPAEIEVVPDAISLVW